jgi:aerobic-type carbon monoxide dehydrogenase small subunit (CoxS/CutS family)
LRHPDLKGIAMAKRSISLKVNGRLYEQDVEPRLTLVDFLRNELDLTGTHVGCEHGVCGACTVLIGGHSARSCLTFAVQADGCEVMTVEGLAPADGELGVLQQAFRDQHGLQCGFCTPGMLMSLTELLRDNPDPSEEEVRDVLTGNLCRCTGYAGAVAAALEAARRLRVQRGA